MSILFLPFFFAKDDLYSIILPSKTVCFQQHSPNCSLAYLHRYLWTSRIYTYIYILYIYYIYIYLDQLPFPPPKAKKRPELQLPGLSPLLLTQALCICLPLPIIFQLLQMKRSRSVALDGTARTPLAPARGRARSSARSTPQHKDTCKKKRECTWMSQEVRING